MPLLIFILALSSPFYNDKIKGIDYYSYFIQSPRIEYTIKALDESDSFEELKYTPHVGSFTGLSVGTKLASISIAFQNENEADSDVEESDLFDIQISSVYQNFLWNIYYQNYQGLYLTDSNEIDEDIANNFEKANSFSYGFGIKYFGREGFSAKNSQSSYSKKKVTDWSWLVGTYYNRNRLYSDDSLIPIEYQGEYDQISTLTAIESINYGVDFGLTGMFTLGGFYTSALLSLGYNLQQQSFDGIDAKTRDHTTTSANASLEVGYDWKNAAIGVNSDIQTISAPVKNAKFDQHRTLINLYYKYFF
jgi:hypothetical protein